MKNKPNKSDMIKIRDGYLALKDIINAAGNGESYNAAELEKEFVPALDGLVDVLERAGGNHADEFAAFTN